MCDRHWLFRLRSPATNGVPLIQSTIRATIKILARTRYAHVILRDASTIPMSLSLLHKLRAALQWRQDAQRRVTLRVKTSASVREHETLSWKTSSRCAVYARNHNMYTHHTIYVTRVAHF